MPAPKLKKCKGLHTSGNRYDIPEGALVQATNILIYKDGVIQPRYGLTANAVNTTLGNVGQWHRMAQLNGTLWFVGYDSVATTAKIVYASTTFAGMTLAQTEDGPDGYANFTTTTQPWYDIEFQPVGNLLYYNCARGLIRIESSTVQRRAGNYPCAVSCIPRPISTSLARGGTTTVTATTAFAHGYVTGIKVKLTSAGDANFGAGEYTVVSVPSTTTFTYVDATSAGNSALASQTFAASNIVGSSGFMATNDRVAYRAVLTEYDTNGVEYVGGVSGRIVVTNATPFIGAGNAKNTQVAIIFPPALLASNTKFELYRSRTAASLEPSDEMGLVYSRFLTAAEVTQGYTWVTDINPDSQIRKALYTNDTQQGAFQNNSRPATAKTVALWKDRLVMANTFDYSQIQMQLLSVDSGSGGMIAGDTIEMYNGSGAATFTAIASGTAPTHSNEFTLFTGGTASTDVKHTILSLIDSINWNGAMSAASSTAITPLTDMFAVYDAKPNDWPGAFRIILTIPNQTEAPTPGSSWVNHWRIYTTLGTRGSFAPKLGTYSNTTAGTVTRATNVTTLTGVSALNKLEVGEYIILFPTSATSTSVPYAIGGTNVEGVILTNNLGGTITISNTGPDGSLTAAARRMTLKYQPELVNNHQINNLQASKPNQFEAFAPGDFVKVGSPAYKILKCVPCKDSLMVFKEDGLYRVTASGAYGESLSAELVDRDAILWAKDSAVPFHGLVVAWLIKGVYLISEQGLHAAISKGRIEDRLSPATFSTQEPPLQSFPYSSRAVGLVDTVHNFYELRICFQDGAQAPYVSTVNLTYCLDADAWVEDDLGVASEVIYNGIRYMQLALQLYVQDQQVYGGLPATTLNAGSAWVSLGSDTYSFTYTGVQPVAGSTALGDNNQTVAYVLTSGGGVGTAYVPDASAIAEGSWTVYTPVISTIEWAPVTFGEENKLKRHRETQVLFGVREQLVTEVTTSSELVTDTETNTYQMGVVSTSVGVNGFSPYNLRCTVPQQHRVGQQLRLQVVVRTSYGAWTILGVGCDADILSVRVNR